MVEFLNTTTTATPAETISFWDKMEQTKVIPGVSVPEFVLGLLLLVLAVALIVLVLVQSGKDKRLSGTIAGAAETFFGKSKAADNEKKLSIATTILSITFAVAVVVMYFYIAVR